jgi:hypothetical protein
MWVCGGMGVCGCVGVLFLYLLTECDGDSVGGCDVVVRKRVEVGLPTPQGEQQESDRWNTG